MARNQKKFTSITTTGLGSMSGPGSRFYKKDGRPNVVKKGMGFFDRLSWFHAMIAMPRWKFYTWLAASYIIVNLGFAFVYYYIGVKYLVGVEHGGSMDNFAEAFFFSAQTFTTVGYGRISPVGLEANAIAAFEAFLGVLSFALASGLFYGRFAKPRAYLKFSDIALITPHKEGIALMFRAAPYKNNHLMDAEVNLTMAMRIVEDGKEKSIFYNLPTEFNKINAFVLNWTVVHYLNEDSPLYGMTVEDMKKACVEIMVSIKAYDEGFANSVVGRSSYTAYEIIEGAKFRPMYKNASSGSHTILYLDRINHFEKAPLPEFKPVLAE